MQHEFYEKLLQNLYDGVYYVDLDRNITFWNRAAERITGYRESEVKGRRCADNILRHLDEWGHELCVSGCPLAKTLKDGKIRDSEIYLHHKEGHRVPVSVRVSPVFNEADRIVGAVEIFSDNSSRLDILREMESLKKEAFTDGLTGVANRRFAEMNLTHRMSDLTAFNVPFGLLFLDIDDFKKFNDTYGHDVGDRVLIMVAATIANILRKMDLVSRWGGEEFVVILPNVDAGKLSEVAERIRRFIEKSWITVDGEELRVTVSLGGAMASPEDSLETLVKRADGKMYESKRMGRNRVTI